MLGGGQTPRATDRRHRDVTGGRARPPPARRTATIPVRASTTGVGQLLLAARDAGARRIVIGCGGSATTDGGLGAYEAVGSPGPVDGVELVVACDVTTAFNDAAAVFGPQKGATPAQVVELGRRLAEVAARYRRETGVDVTGRARAPARPAGWPAAWSRSGPASSPGSTSWPAGRAWPARLQRADLVVTGEGHLDPPVLRGQGAGWRAGVGPDPRATPPAAGPVHRRRRRPGAARLTAGRASRSSA